MKIRTAMPPPRTGNDRIALRQTLPSLQRWAAEQAAGEALAAARLAADPGCFICGEKPTKRAGGQPYCAGCFPRAA